MLINIGSTKDLDSRRVDKYHNLGNTSFKDLIKETTKFCHCPITIGSGLREVSEIENLFNAGADKITLNTLCFENPSKVKEQ